MTYNKCKRCNETGEIRDPRNPQSTRKVPCPSCDGEGWVLVDSDDEENRDDMDDYLWPESIRWQA